MTLQTIEGRQRGRERAKRREGDRHLTIHTRVIHESRDTPRAASRDKLLPVVGCGGGRRMRPVVRDG